MHRPTIKLYFRPILAGFFIGAACAAGRAGVITGSISGTSTFTPYVLTNGTGTKAADLVAAHSLVFSNLTAGVSNTGSFAAYGTNTTITFQNPFQVNPPVVTNAALWTVGPYSFTVSSFTTIYDATNYLVITANGLLKDGTNADVTAASFLATFTQNQGPTYTWNFQAAPNPAPTLTLTGLIPGNTLSWTTNSTNFVLQATPAMSKFPVWTNLTNIPVIVGSNYVVSNLVTTNGQRYFRLKH